MSRTALFYSPEFLKHVPRYYHPENPGRLEAIIKRLEKSPLWDRLERPIFHRADETLVETVHDPGYIIDVKESTRVDSVILDYGDTYACRESYDVAMLAVGALLRAVDMVMDGEVDNAFCAVRPPGHHSEEDRALGFCIFNNIAIAAAYAKSEYDVERILIVDWDVHHGNGTQHTFEADPSVFYFSMHQYPHYPGTGRADERGIGPGIGFTRNFPMSPGTSEAEWMKVFEEELPPIAAEFKPELVLVSAGYDGHEADPLASLSITTQGFRRMAEIVKELAEKYAGGRMIATLEGGYAYDALAASVEATIEVFLGEEEKDEDFGPTETLLV
ncbi:MAG: histone deacetylase [Bradymonadales bacterium]|nr:histone deacetylase [Bradymonadales bacterium]